MTTNIDLSRAPDFPSGADLAGIVNDDPFRTALISRLANEIFAEHHPDPRKTALPVPPTTPPSFEPAKKPGLPSWTQPSADTPEAGTEVVLAAVRAAPSGVAAVPWAAGALSGPSAGAGPELVLPGYGAGPSPRPSPGNEPGPATATGLAPFAADEVYPFGEPRYIGALTFGHHAQAPTEAQYGAAAAPDFYFLEHGRQPKTAAPAEPRPRDHTPAPNRPAAPLSTFDVQAIRRDFPALHQTVNGKPLVWLDNAATTHKPQSVIDITSEYYARHNSNIHRAAHTLAARSTDLFEGARDKLRDFVGAADSREIVFLRGTTEAINLVAQSYGRRHFGPGDEIVITHIEHHANIVPWQLIAEATGAILKVAPVNDRGELIFEKFLALLGPRTRFVSATHVANALGTINPIEQIIASAHAWGVPVLVDAAQSSPHIPLDVRALDADFLVLSGHKVFGPTGIGILYGKAHLLEALPPWQGGGHMIKDVTFEKTVFNHIPEKFEAGTPDIAGAVGLGAAIDYLQRVGLPTIAAYEHDLLVHATEALSTVPKLKLIGTAAAKASVLSFVIDGHAPDAVSRHLDKHGIATRSGHHCAQPALRRFGVETTVRASLAFYNTREDVEALVRALHLLPRT